jgi:hypothetical protein
VNARTASPFKAALHSIANSDDLNRADRKHLARWTNDCRTDEAWSKIQKKVRSPVDEETFAQIFIRETLATRRVAEADQWPEFLTHAVEAESLAKFLRGTPIEMLMLPPVPDLVELVPLLEKAGRRLREVASHGMHVSRQHNDGLRPRRVFMRMISTDLIQELCGQPVDDAVCILTDIAFPDRETTIDQVRAARKPTTRRGRSARG